MKELILIDDDKLMHLSFKMYCDLKLIKLTCFFDVESFLEKSNNFNKDVEIYIDSNLGNGQKGEIKSEEIFKMGFHNISLTTGFKESDIIKPLWIKSIYGKDPRKIF